MSPRKKAIFAALLIFFCGTVTGAGFGAWFGLRTMLRMLQSSPDETALADVAISHIHDELSSQLELDEATRAALMAELKSSAILVKRARAEGVSIMAHAMGDTQKRIAALLPEEKREQFFQISWKRLDQFGLGGFVPPPPKKDSAGQSR